ncbi:MAG: hypothetical protein JWM58_575 [Rhizobium sp.]|nr:hypothetical protein [Rhizobium sp.]
MSEITLWKPEPDLILHQALGKLAEELGELTQIVARCLIQGYTGSDPKTQQHNYVRLREEMADVLAAIDWLSELRHDLETYDSPRHLKKLKGFRQWQKMLEDDARAAP